MWFRIFLAFWSLAFVVLLAWLATHKSAAPTILGRYSAVYFAVLAGFGVLAAASLLGQTAVLYRRLHRVRWEVVLTLLSFVLSLTIAEVAVRVLDPLGVSYFEESSKYHLDKVADPVLVYKHAPHLRRIYQGVEVSTNELGLRDRSIGKKPAGELRILLLGDSVTFGWGVPVEATFGRKLETLLAAELARPVRTVNAGVGSYNTVQEHAFLAINADVIEADLVVLVYVDNDIEPTGGAFDPWSQRALSGKTPPQAIGLLLERSWLYRLGLFVFQYSRAKTTAPFDRDARGVKESMDALAAIAAFCRERNIDFATFFYRPAPGSSAEDSSGLLSEVERTADENGFLMEDIGLWWGGADMRSMTNSVIDSHLNARGHDLLAGRMASSLVTHGLVNKTGEASR
jgi:lysophospholipase L1-like esterase